MRATNTLKRMRRRCLHTFRRISACACHGPALPLARIAKEVPDCEVFLPDWRAFVEGGR